jgi:histidine ammonia-lyase
VVENAQAVVAVELLLAAQALELAERDLDAYPVGAWTAAAWSAVRAIVSAMPS